MFSLRPKQEILINGQWKPVDRFPAINKFRLILTASLVLFVLTAGFLVIFRDHFFGGNSYAKIYQGNDRTILGQFNFQNQNYFLTNDGFGISFSAAAKVNPFKETFIKLAAGETIISVNDLGDNSFLVMVNTKNNETAFYHWVSQPERKVINEITFLGSQGVRAGFRNDGMFLLNSNWLVWRVSASVWKKILLPVPQINVSDWLQAGTFLFLLDSENTIWKLDLNKILENEPNIKWKTVIKAGLRKPDQRRSPSFLLQVLPNRITFLNSSTEIENWELDEKFFRFRTAYTLAAFKEQRNFLFSAVPFQHFTAPNNSTGDFSADCFAFDAALKCFDQEQNYFQVYRLSPTEITSFSNDQYTLLTVSPQ